MMQYTAKGVSPGIGMAPIRVISRMEGDASKRGQGIDHETKRYQDALEKTSSHLKGLVASDQVAPPERGIFEAHCLMLEDPELSAAVFRYIDEGYDASAAVMRAKEDLKDIFLSMEDEYFRARASDVEDVMNRISGALGGNRPASVDGECILVSDELYPSETLEMDLKSLKGIATLRGNATGHTTILANNLKIPAVISLDVVDINALDGKFGILDADAGLLIADPDEATRKSYLEKIRREEEHRSTLQALVDREAITSDGRRLGVYANIGSDLEAREAYAGGAEGIGLFRSEFLFLGRDEAPDEEEQYRAYKNALLYMQGRPVIIRTLDIGADKSADYLELEREDNPQMGLRAIRLSLRRPEMFKCQLRALLRAAHHGNLSVMLPMIISAGEIEQTKALLETCREELRAEGKAAGSFPLGIMIETPAAALIAEDLAREVEFFSIGTNDLVSYTLALDRTNPQLEPLRDDRHPAVLRLIERTARAAKQAGIDCGICGAMGADLDLLDFFLDIGIDEVSVPIGKVLEVKERILSR